MDHGHYLQCDEKLTKEGDRGVMHLALEKHCSGLLTEEGIQVGTGGQDGGWSETLYTSIVIQRRDDEAVAWVETVGIDGNGYPREMFRGGPNRHNALPSPV